MMKKSFLRQSCSGGLQILHGSQPAFLASATDLNFTKFAGDILFAHLQSGL